MKAAPMTALLLGAAALAAGCAAGSAPDRAVAPSPRPVVLTMASALTDGEQLGTFVHEVSALTGGTVRIDVRSHWRPGQVGYESALIADVRAGKADLGAASSWAFDSAGVLSLRALGAPLLITSYAAEQAVLASPVTTKLLGALRPAGLTGIGILPGDLFRPDGAAGPLVKPSDYAGRRIGTQQSSVAEATLLALGAQPEWFPAAGTITRFDGVIQPTEKIYGYQYNRVARFLTTNVALWPRPLVLFGNGRAMGKLTAVQRQALRQAAIAALPGSMKEVQGDEQECGAGPVPQREAHRRNRGPGRPRRLAHRGRTGLRPARARPRDPQRHPLHQRRRRPRRAGGPPVVCPPRPLAGGLRPARRRVHDGHEVRRRPGRPRA